MVRRWFPRNRQRWLLRLMLVLGVSGAGVWLAWAWQSHGGRRTSMRLRASARRRLPFPARPVTRSPWRPIWDVSRWSWFSIWEIFEAGVVSSSGAATAPGSISGRRGRRHGHQY